MAFDPNKHPRDEKGQWAVGAGGHAQKAVDWLKSGEAKAVISKLSAPENIKQAATMAIQGALFKIGVNDPHIDQLISHQVRTFANDVKVTRAHARQIMLTAVKALKKASK
jgi:hypothetical protein